MSTPQRPPFSDLSRRMASLTAERRALVDLLLQDRRTAAPSLTIGRRAPSATAPVSFAQQRMWLLDQMVPGSPYYNETNACRLRNVVDAGAMERAVNEIARRHEALRTWFTVVQDQPVQVIAPELHVPLPLIDLRPYPAAQRAAEARRRAEQDAALPFDLSRLPLFRTTLMQLGTADFVFVVTMHHIVCDGWSMPVFFRELSSLYDAFARGLPSPLPELRIQYADYAVWQRERIAGPLLDEQLAYWRTQLADLPVLQLPTDRPRPASPSYAGARQHFRVAPELTGGLAAVAQQEDATLFMVLLAAWNVLLSRYTGQDDLAVGVPVANRTHTELESLIGFFVNSLVIRTRLDGNPTFRDVLRRVRHAALGAYAHQDVPFERIVEDQHPERDTARHPLFQVIFQFFTIPRGAADDTHELGLDLTTAKFDLRLDLYQASSGLIGFVEYSTDLFEARSIGRLIGHYQTLLAGIAIGADVPAAELPMLTAGEREQLLGDWHAAPAGWDGIESIPGRFERQVARAPTAPALIAAEEIVTYAELNRRANRLAHRLMAAGVGPEVLVGVTAERSVDTIVALVGIVKAGGAYVPIDPVWPVERQRLIARETGLRLALARGSELDALAPEHVTLLAIGDEIEKGADEENPSLRARTDELLYVMPTSGSTGSPKGVCVPQRGVLRLVIEPNFVRLDPSETLLQFAPLPFDASTFEIWGALLNGARLAIFPPYTPSLDELGRAIETFEVTTLWLTGSLFRLMVDEQLARLRGVRQLLAGGEVLSVPHVQRLRAELPACALINGYGPTENTTFTCTFDTSTTADPSELSPVPIGRPISGTRVYVCDRAGGLVPIGVGGELYIGGTGLARGYWGGETLTAERFVPSPFVSGERLYRSGDLVRWRSSGVLEFLGRLDDQVKVRGFRVEPGEIEAVLSRHPTVREVAVVPSRDPAGSTRLIAYVTLGPLAFDAGYAAGVTTNAAVASALRAHLRDTLPEYMIPAAIVVLGQMPLTASGKVDRRALASGEEVPPASGAPPVAPRSEVEAILADIWAQLLQIDRIGVFDNFFELGGHSLLGTQLISRVRAAFRIELPLRRLFDLPTIAGLAEAIEQERRAPGVPAARIVPMSTPQLIDQLSDEEVDAMLRGMLGDDA